MIRFSLVLSFSGVMSKRSTPSGSGQSTPSSKKARKRKTERTVWNTPDDWETLLAESTLSTSSISTRRPRLRGLPTLAKCCQESAARSFKRLWEAGQTQVQGEIIVGPGRWWKDDWAWVPDHLKLGVRDAVFRYWGGSLSLQMLQEVGHSLVAPSCVFCSFHSSFSGLHRPARTQASWRLTACCSKYQASQACSSLRIHSRWCHPSGSHARASSDRYRYSRSPLPSTESRDYQPKGLLVSRIEDRRYHHQALPTDTTSQHQRHKGYIQRCQGSPGSIRATAVQLQD